MAIQTENPTRSGSSTKVTTYVNQQLEMARRGVKSTDLIGEILTLVAIVISFLILAAIWDGWIQPMSVAGRWVAFGLMMSICLVFVVLKIFPLLIKKINPQYAAQMIEQSSPTFKNSLLNYVTLRKKEEEINPVVFQAVSRQAAENLATVPDGASIDRSKLIFWGFVLVGLLMFTVGYKMISPKDPFQSFLRVLVPPAKIAQPSRVDISEVKPGDTRIFFGEQLEVSAVIRGKFSPEDVHLLISTLDGQSVNQKVAMEAEDAPGRYRVTLGKNVGGLQQSFNYQIVARDGLSPVYEVNVQSNPTIAIETLHLQPPRYTKAPKQTITGRGEVDALEGTRVEVEAIANLPIKEAHLDLLVFKESENPNRTNNFQTLKSIPMEVEGNKAKANFWALLNPARDKSLASHYQLRFVSTTDDRNQKPNVYPIKVTPDLAPELRVLRPTNLEVSVAENGSMVFDVEANDLDYEISELTVHLNHRAVNTLQQRIETQPVGNGLQRVNGRFVLQPKQAGLKDGDKAILFFTTSDNRTAPGEEDRPDPNVSRSDNYTINVTAAEAQPREPQDPLQNPRQPDQPKNPEQEKPQKDPADQDSKPSGKEDSKDPAAGDQKKSSSEKDNGSSTEKSESQPDSQPDQSEKQNPENGNPGNQGSSADDEKSKDGKPDSKENPQQGNEGTSEPNDGSQSKGSEGGSENKGSESQNGSESQKGNDSGSGSQGSSGSSQSSDGSEQGDSGIKGSQKGAQPSGSQAGSNSDPSNADDQGDGGGTQSPDSRDQGGNPQGSSPGGNPGSKGNGQPSSPNDGGNEDPSNANGAESRDNDLKSGKRNPLSKEATQSEQMRRLEEMLNDKKDSQKNGDSQPKGDSQGNEPGEPKEDGAGNEDAGNDGSPKDGSPKDGSPKDGSPKDGSPKDGSPKDGSPKDGSPKEQSDGSESSQNQSSEQGDSKPNEPAGACESGEQKSEKGSQDGKGQAANKASKNGTGGGKSSDGEVSDGSPGQSDGEDSNSSASPNKPKSSSPGGKGLGPQFDIEKEKVNLDHAKKATDLILKRLNEQRYEPDPKLLEEMNWSKEDLNQFLGRWQEMKNAAEKGDVKAQRRYEQSLKSLDFRANAKMRKVDQSKEEVKGLNQDSEVVQPPPEFAPDFNATLRDLNRNDGR